MPEAIWITWENQIRNKSLSGRLGVELHVFSSKRMRFVRYAVCVSSTVILIWTHRPSVVFAQNPSIVLTYLVMLLKYVFRYTFVTDAHYAGIMAPDGNRLFQKVLDFCNRLADLIIVTNEEHGNHVEAIGGRALVCEDPLPDIVKYAGTVIELSKKVTDPTIHPDLPGLIWSRMTDRVRLNRQPGKSRSCPGNGTRLKRSCNICGRLCSTSAKA